MNPRFIRSFAGWYIFALILTSLGIAYQRQVDNTVSSVSADTTQTLLQTEQVKNDQLKSTVDQTTAELQAKQNELAKKSAEVDAKKAELDKATSDLAAKIKDLDAAQKKIKDQQSQLSVNASELSSLRSHPPLFSFQVDSTSLQNSEAKKQQVKDIVTAAYDVIQGVYNQPYLLHAVTIDFVDTFDNPGAAAETVISNGKDGLSITIKIKDFDQNNFSDVNAVIHEMVHAFHGLAVLSPVAYEEGSAVAVADIVMQKLIADKKIPSFSPLYIRISHSDYANSSDTIPADTNAFYSSSHTADWYQLEGYGWYQMYKANNDFFKTFNEKIYDKKRNGTEITADLVKQAIKESVSGTVDGKSVDDWLKTKAFALQ